MATADLILAAVPSRARPEWSRSPGVMSSLVATAQGELALRAAAQILDERAGERHARIVEAARVVTGDGLHEGVYVRTEAAP